MKNFKNFLNESKPSDLYDFDIRNHTMGGSDIVSFESGFFVFRWDIEKEEMTQESVYFNVDNDDELNEWVELLNDFNEVIPFKFTSSYILDLIKKNK